MPSFRCRLARDSQAHVSLEKIGVPWPQRRRAKKQFRHEDLNATWFVTKASFVTGDQGSRLVSVLLPLREQPELGFRPIGSAGRHGRWLTIVP